MLSNEQRKVLMAMTLPALHEFVRDAIDVLKARRDEESRKKSWTLGIGEKVEFAGRGGAKVVGTVKEIKIKKAIVIEKRLNGEEVRWTVPMHMLSMAKSNDAPIITTVDPIVKEDMPLTVGAW